MRIKDYSKSLELTIVKPQTTPENQKIIDEGISNEIEDKKLQEKQ